MATILVTGVGAVIGYGVLRSMANTGHQLIGLDIYADAYGQHLSHNFVQAIPTADPAYPAFLENVLRRYKPDLVLPCIEQDVARFDGLRSLFSDLGIACCLNARELIALANDKWRFHEAERANGLPSIESSPSSDFDELVSKLGLPFLLKPRQSYAGKGIVEISSRAQFENHQSRMGKTLFAQRIVGSKEEEYTVGLFGSGSGSFCAQIQMRRILSSEGATQKAWVVNEETLTDRLAALCAVFKPLGPTNLQFRREGDLWHLLEINPRISSAASLRAAFGYNDAEQALKYYVHGEMPEQPHIRGGRAIRYIEDHIEFDDRTYF
ncbi:MAG TPA: ATP-grasp domain-containing protein [Terriglobales bacterium]|nr:ATP-grasp domain-containing protein [Terriglobales bacterium]